MGIGEPQAALQVISHADLCLQERTFGNKTQTFKSVVTVPSARWCPFSGHFECFTNSHGGSLTTLEGSGGRDRLEKAVLQGSQDVFRKEGC